MKMERKIGEIFENNGEWYQCVEGTGCYQCAFNQDAVTCLADNPHCTSRSDRKDVVFKRLEKVGEPYSCNYYGNNKLIMMQEYNLYNLDDVTNEDKIPMYITDYKHKRIAIEIKQNKEDMEEYRMHDAKEDIPEFDKVVDECLFGEDKLNLKPFDLQKAKAGKPVCTRDGRKARIICFDRRLFYKNVSYPILALVECSDGEDLIEDGAEYKDDLMMLPEKKEGWAVIFKDDLLRTEKEAQELAGNSISEVIRIEKIEWEE